MITTIIQKKRWQKHYPFFSDTDNIQFFGRHFPKTTFKINKISQHKP